MVRDVEFVTPVRSLTRGRRRDPNALQRRRQAEIDRLLAEGRARIGRLSEREFLVAGVALYAGEGSKRDGSVLFANSDPPDDRLLLLVASVLLPGRRVPPTASPLSTSGPRSGHRESLLVSLTGIPESQFVKPYRAVADPSIRNAKHVHGCVGVRYSCSATHRSIMGLVGALLGDAVTPG